MEISNRAKERFCKDCNIPIRLFQEPYFLDRIKLFDDFYGTVNKWIRFASELQQYSYEQDYFEEYNHVKDTAITSIKNSEAYQRFNAEDMNKFTITHKDLPNKDIFKTINDGRIFISIDMKKANFSSLHEYDRNIFRGNDTWEDFISQFTDNEHIINSKYIRQVILGNCNPKRHITYEKYLMDQTLSLLYDIVDEERIVFFSNDEIVYDMTTANNLHMLNLVRNCVEERLSTKSNIPFRVELFSLHKINGTDGYCKKIYKENGEYNIEFKCLDNYMMPFVLRYFLGEEITESDKVFYHEGLLAKFIDEPKIEVNLDEKIEKYIVDIVFATRYPEKYDLKELKDMIGFGGSPRASINLALAARTYAFIKRRGYVIPEDVRAVAHDVLRHRIGLTYEAEAMNMSSDEIVSKILNKVEVP